MRTLKRILTATTAAIAFGGTAVAFTSAASASARDGVCDAGEFCYYYNSNNEGSVSDFTGSVADYGTTQPSCYDFKGPGAGQGLCIKNAAASVWNRSGQTVRVHYNSDYGGASQDFAAGAKGNLSSALKNQNASHQFNPSTRTNMSYGLYELSGGSITCGFDGYTSTPGRHEGIDIARGIGSDVHALVSGEVIYIARGANGGSGLSTISVYNSSLNKTVIYLHSAPRSALAVGQQVGRGQVIADEAWRGISSSSGAHTHVEMRLGRQTHAAKSVNDYTLDNPNPTSFWNSQGYNVH
ncbi:MULTISPECIES: peptidase inhibitor family I36 protein [Actinomadura]|uniref:Peptidoglycan DD-metalloendopeptidase family protein n=1 Tax=Actinomadura litoris TaxID=2678616 RepID=A0A7K1KTB0_9ACTN|nr:MULTISPECIES: peptidase inhibitor family I36 protein [Actinomadura]MBT2207772.1 peptidase inhibitor family I36 protein [Actinomadura sp. NEAU-AAG7]MUN35428.1 peptidoglycan DD-metalloendopeptidase family protein [Actinomadura litoris]